MKKKQKVLTYLVGGVTCIFIGAYVCNDVSGLTANIMGQGVNVAGWVLLIIGIIKALNKDKPNQSPPTQA